VAVKRALLLAVAAALLLVGCSGGDDSAEGTTDSVTVTLPAFSNARVYWLRDGKVWPVLRDVQATGGTAANTLAELIAGPNDDEKGDLAATTAVPSDGDAPEPTIENGVASVEFGEDLSQDARAQIVYTLTDLPGVDAVEIDGKRYTRADFEEQTPIILVESPLPFEEVTTPLRVTGTANTFEATFQYELVDSAGKVVDKNFVTATSGTGTRGTFDFTTKKVGDVAALRVFELSAEDGSRIHEVEIPLTTTT
jgi:hypothetical protein